MHADDRGDFGFLESMMATMAVILVLTAFLGLAVGSAVVSSDPTDGLDPGMITGSIVDGEFVPAFEGYILDLMDSERLSGATVTVTVPGGFCRDPGPFVFGEMDGAMWSRSVTSLVPLEGFGEVVAIFEVVLCARTTAGSSRWWTRCSS